MRKIRPGGKITWAGGGNKSPGLPVRFQGESGNLHHKRFLYFLSERYTTHA
jgi:hypothetical protein